MKKFLIISLLVLLWTNPVMSEMLVCDLPSDYTTLIASQVSIDGNGVPGVMDPGPTVRIWVDPTDNSQWMVLLDEASMASLAAGRHIFIARVQDSSGWWSDWSGPLDAGKPGTLGNVKVVE